MIRGGRGVAPWDAGAARIRAAVEAAAERCAAGPGGRLAVALSGGLDSSIAAHAVAAARRRAGEAPPEAVAVVADGFPAGDAPYCRAAARHLGLRLEVVGAGESDMLEAAEGAVRALRAFGGIEVRNMATMWLAARAARRRGIGAMVTGDGADELFAGYSFFLRAGPGELAAMLRRMRRIMRFPSGRIGRSLGVEVRSPFMSAGVADAAAGIPAQYMVRPRGRSGPRTGKWILRRAFEGALPPAVAWREKCAMQDGSGTGGLARVLEGAVSDAEYAERAARILDEDGVRVGGKESLHYYEAYRRAFGRPERAADPAAACRLCGCAARSEAGSRFCRMCGAYPA